MNIRSERSRETRPLIAMLCQSSRELTKSRNSGKNKFGVRKMRLLILS